MQSSTRRSRPRSRASTQRPSPNKGLTVRTASALVALLLLAPASLSSASSAGDKSAGDRSAIEELLQRRAAAVLQRDRDAFLATVDEGSAEFYERQGTLFDNMEGLPLREYRLTAAWDRVGDLVRPSDKARYGSAEDVAIPLTEERYAIEGFDPRPAAEDMFYTYVKRDGRWLIAEDTDLDDIALYTVRHLWDFGPITSQRSDHFLVLSHACGAHPDDTTGGCRQIADGLVDVAEGALAQVGDMWTLPWPGRVAVLVPGSTEELSRMIQATFPLDNFVAFAYSSVDVEDGLKYTGHRIMLNPSSFEGRGGDETETILVHELTHVASRKVAGPFIPLFIEEGIAEYVGYGGARSLAYLDSRVAAGLFDEKLPKDFEFSTGGSNEIYNSYQEGQSAVRYFVERWGLKRFLRFYSRLGRARIEAGMSRYHVDRVLRAVVGLGLDEFERAWADSITP